MDGLDGNDTSKRPISLQQHLYQVRQANLFRGPKIIFRGPKWVATHSLRNPALEQWFLTGFPSGFPAKSGEFPVVSELFSDDRHVTFRKIFGPQAHIFKNTDPWI